MCDDYCGGEVNDGCEGCGSYNIDWDGELMQFVCFDCGLEMEE